MAIIVGMIVAQIGDVFALGLYTQIAAWAVLGYLVLVEPDTNGHGRQGADLERLPGNVWSLEGLAGAQKAQGRAEEADLVAADLLQGFLIGNAARGLIRARLASS